MKPLEKETSPLNMNLIISKLRNNQNEFQFFEYTQLKTL